MADLDDKIKQAANNLMMEQEGIPVDWDFCGKNFVAQIHKAFADEGYSIPPSPQGWLMTGQEWYDRLQEELKQAQYVVHKDDLVTVLNKAAKRAAGLE